jgi:hypothetical protein
MYFILTVWGYIEAALDIRVESLIVDSITQKYCKSAVHIRTGWKHFVDRPEVFK